MDTGWLLVGVAGVAGGLALVLVGASIAATPLLLPLGLSLAGIAYLAWAAGSARVVATAYEDVGDSGRRTGSHTGRGGNRADPDGNWRGTAADGGRASGVGPSDGSTTGETHSGPSAGRNGARGRGDGRSGLGPNGERIWDARERDRVGGWDDWEGERAGADRHWHAFHREHAASGRGPDAAGERDRSDQRDAGSGEYRDRRQEQSRSNGSDQKRRYRDRRRRNRRRDSQRREQRRRGAGPGERGRAPGETSRGERTRAKRARDLLGVSADADAETIRAAYRDRVKEVHPDRGGSSEQFKRVQWAYEYLTDE